MEKRTRFAGQKTLKQGARKNAKNAARVFRGEGLQNVTSNPDRQGQTIHATLPEGEHLVMRVRSLCWNRGADHRDLN